MKEELASEKAKNATLKAELESILKKMQFIIIDAILHARAKLMGEFKRGEHATWDPDQEIQTWEKRAAALAKGDEQFEEKKEDESSLVAGSPMHVELGDSSKQVEPEAGTRDVVGDEGYKEYAVSIVSHEDITKD